MKKLIAVLILTMMVFSISACGSAASTESSNIKAETSQDPVEEDNTPTEAPIVPTEVPVIPTEPPIVPTEIPTTSTEDLFGFGVNTEGVTTTDELETRMEEHLESLIESLNVRWESLSAEIDTYEKYCAGEI